MFVLRCGSCVEVVPGCSTSGWVVRELRRQVNCYSLLKVYVRPPLPVLMQCTPACCYDYRGRQMTSAWLLLLLLLRVMMKLERTVRSRRWRKVKATRIVDLEDWKSAALAKMSVATWTAAFSVTGTHASTCNRSEEVWIRNLITAAVLT